MAERYARPGDNWALRYDCMKFHIPTSFCELPYMSKQKGLHLHDYRGEILTITLSIAYQKHLQTPHLLTKDELAEQVRRYVATFT